MTWRDRRFGPIHAIVLSVPGQVARIDDDFVAVTTGSGKVRLLSHEADGIPVAPGDLCRSVRQRFT
jgi:hypothetical protein